jgi:transcriptional regulator with XRE-family HTH domain
MESKIMNITRAMPVKNRFAELLEKKQKQEGRYVSLAEVANVTGVTRRTLYKWQENKITQYDTKVIDALCAYFDVSFTELLEHSLPDPQPKQKTARK